MHLVLEVFQDTKHPNKEILVFSGMLSVLSLDVLKFCKSVARSDLVLDADQGNAGSFPCRFTGVYLVSEGV